MHEGPLKRVLLVEDDSDTREVYREALEYGGFLVSVAGDGGDAMRLAMEFRPDLVLMDINLPTVSGWEATKLLKDEPETRAIPVIAISANASEAYRRRAESSQFEAYLVKPLSPTDVLAEVQRVIGKAAGRPTA